MFLRCSGVTGGEEEGDDGASVGEDALEGESTDGSNSLSGTGGDTSGLRVMRSKERRREALADSMYVSGIEIEMNNFDT